jgi:hypothetical protein
MMSYLPCRGGRFGFSGQFLNRHGGGGIVCKAADRLPRSLRISGIRNECPCCPDTGATAALPSRLPPNRNDCWRLVLGIGMERKESSIVDVPQSRAKQWHNKIPAMLFAGTCNVLAKQIGGAVFLGDISFGIITLS